MEQGGRLVVGVRHPLFPGRGGIARRMAGDEGVAAHRTAPAQPGVQATRGGDARLDGGGSEAATLQLPEVHGGSVGVRS